MESDWPSSIDSYQLNFPIGLGAWGLVWNATVIEGDHSNEDVAIKIIDLDKFEDFSIDELKKEINVMSQYSHPNLISSYISFIDRSELCIVMPLIDAGSLLDVLNNSFKNGIEDEAVIATVLKSVLQGLDYLHRNGEMHRDIKAGNMFADSAGNIFLGDFGVSANLKKGEKRKTFVGSPCWMAPEVIEQHRGYDFSADIWSIGITAIELAEGEAPNMGMPAMKIVISIINNDPPTLRHPKRFSKEFSNFIELWLKKNPERRPSADELLNHKFFNKAEDEDYLVDNFLCGVKDLKDRIDEGLVKLGEEFLEKRKRSK